jgi:hypothetical protein
MISDRSLGSLSLGTLDPHHEFAGQPSSRFSTIATQPVCQDKAWNSLHNSLKTGTDWKKYQSTALTIEDVEMLRQEIGSCGQILSGIEPPAARYSVVRSLVFETSVRLVVLRQ